MKLPCSPSLALALAASLLPLFSLSAASIEKLEHGVLLRTADETIQLEVFSPAILHVQATPLDAIPSHPGYMVVEENRVPTDFEILDRRRHLELKTSALTARVDKRTGRVEFFDAAGRPLLAELPGGRSYTPATVLEEDTYHVQQRFQMDNVEIIHGLGGHQDGIINFKGKDALLAQYNTVDINTFFLTDDHWGLLWDNNSITRFGDPREYQPLSVLDLRDAEGQPGALTADYFTDDAFSEPVATRREDHITYEYLSSFGDLPTGFDVGTGSIRWSGTIAAKEEGTHKFQFYGSGYTRIWIDDVLMVDSWRVDWMPWTDLFELEMAAGEPRKIEVEWDARDGYSALEVLPPEPPELDEQIVLTSEVGEKVNYYFVHGDTPDAIIANYRLLTGAATLMPDWSLGKWQSRERYKTQEELLEVVREFRARGMPLDAIVQDWNYWPEDEWGNHTFDASRFPDPAGMVEKLHEELNTRIMISIWPKFYEGIRNYDRFHEKGWLYMRNIEVGARDWIGEGYKSTFYDAFNPAAGQLFWETISEELFSKGFDAWWLDATEPDMHSNISVHERKRRMHPTHTGSGARNYNAYSINNSRAIYEGQRAEAPDQRVFILTRSSFAGQQRYGAATWSGDVASRWEDFHKQIAYGINFSAAGIPYWTTDIGGFSVEPRYEAEPMASEDLEEWRELNMRWYQFGAFSPLFRVHGQYPYREFYYVAPEGHPVYEGMLKYAQLRYRLMPYIYSLAGAVTHDGYTFARPLMMDFGEDKNVSSIDDAYMFGPSVLVCPVTEYRAREREVYLPAGADWYDLHTGDKHNGGQTIVAPAPLGDMPLYIRAGSIVPLGPDVQYVGEMPDAPVELRVYPGADATFTLYEDEGATYAYERGEYAKIDLTWDDATRTLEIGERRGHYEGMPTERIFRLVLVEGTQGRSGERAAQPDKTIKYDGHGVSIAL